MDFCVAFRSAKWASLQVPLSETPILLLIIKNRIVHATQK